MPPSVMVCEIGNDLEPAAGKKVGNQKFVRLTKFSTKRDPEGA